LSSPLAGGASKAAAAARSGHPRRPRSLAPNCPRDSGSARTEPANPRSLC
jgi:hypothetical protein